MNTPEYRIGMLIEHPNAPEWGPGRILQIQERILTIQFRDIPDPGRAVKKISLDHATLRIAAVQTDEALDRVPPVSLTRTSRMLKNPLSPRLLKKAEMQGGGRSEVRGVLTGTSQHRASPPTPQMGLFQQPARRIPPSPRRTFEQLIQSFLHFHPLGFEDPTYIGDLSSGERAYKQHAHDLFVAGLGHGVGERLLAEGQLAEVRKRAKKCFGGIFNLLFPQEEMALTEGLKDDQAAARFFNALFEVLASGRPEPQTFQRFIDAVNALPFRERKTKPAKWTVLTVYPFIARPDAFMFLKPKVTQAVAEALSFSLQYRSDLNWRTYERLLALSSQLADELSRRSERSLHPRDWIDVQSFIWVSAQEHRAM